jgi:hypothetical protein
MSKLLRQNIGGTDFTMVGCTLTGVCNSAASDYVKSVTLTDGDTLSDGMTIVVDFTNGNTAGTAPASMTIYSSDQVNYYSDSGLTQPFTLAPAGCYEITYTGEGNAYNYISYPVMQVGSVSGPLCDASGKKASGALWLAKDKVSINYSNGCFSVIPQATNSMTVTAASSVVNGAPVRIGSTVRVLFTQDLTGAANTGLVLTYNGVGIPVMVGKNGSLGALLPFDVGGGTYKYLQAYTTLEMTYDGTKFIIMGNPVVISNSDYTVYADGSITYKNNIKEIQISEITYNSQIFSIDSDYTKIYYDDNKMWGTIRYQALVNVLAWGTHLTITPLVGRFSMKQQFFRDAISNQMVSLQDFITTTGALEAYTIIQITFCVGIKHI